jgi:peptidoglycan L-alanyl-D-glutamate endopeptidase CwlK
MIFGKRSKDNLVGVHPDLVRLMEAAIINSPIDFTITEGVRTAKEQQILYAQGRTTKGPIVTTKDGVKNKSNHQIKADGFGHAVDLYPFVDGKVQVTDKDTVPNLKKIATHIKKCAKAMRIEIVWGGDWKTPYDPPHFELKL